MELCFSIFLNCVFFLVFFIVVVFSFNSFIRHQLPLSCNCYPPTPLLPTYSQWAWKSRNTNVFWNIFSIDEQKKQKHQSFFGTYIQPMSMKKQKQQSFWFLLFWKPFPAATATQILFLLQAILQRNRHFVKLEYRMGGVQKGYFL